MKRAAQKAPESPWTDASVKLPREPGLYLCLCRLAPIGRDRNATVFPEIIAYRMKDSDESFRVTPHVQVLYWMPIPPEPQQSFL